MLVCFVLNAEESEEDFQKISINDKPAERDLETKVSEARLPTRNNISRPKLSFFGAQLRRTSVVANLLGLPQECSLGGNFLCSLQTVVGAFTSI